MTERLCECGCGKSLAGKKASARFFDRACKARARRRRQDPVIGSPERKAAQADGLCRSGKDGLQKAIRRDLAYREVLPAAFKNPADHKGHERAGWRAYQDKDREAQRDRTDVDAGRHPRGRLGQKPMARKKSYFRDSPPPGVGRYGPTGPLRDHRDSKLYKAIGRDRFVQIVRRFNLARRLLNEGPVGTLARKLGLDWDLGYSEVTFNMAARPVLDEFAGTRAALKGTQQLIGGEMSPVATDSQLVQTVYALEACRAVIADCIELISSRFPDDDRVQAAVERLIESSRN